MRRKLRSHVVDFYRAEDQPPRVGDLIREVSHTALVRGYLRVHAVRQVKVRVSRGEVARYRLQVERLACRPAGEPVTFTVDDYAPKPKVDRFSPLL